MRSGNAGREPTPMVADTTFNSQKNNQNKLLAQIVARLAALSASGIPQAGTVGTYALAKSTVAAAFGASVTGSALTPSNAAGTHTGSALSGTWTCMGYINASGDVALFVRSA